MHSSSLSSSSVSHHHQQQQHQLHHHNNSTNLHHQHHHHPGQVLMPVDLLINPNAPGPPQSQQQLLHMTSGLPKIMSQLSAPSSSSGNNSNNHKHHDHLPDLNHTSSSLKSMNHASSITLRQHSAGSVGSMSDPSSLLLQQSNHHHPHSTISGNHHHNNSSSSNSAISTGRDHPMASPMYMMREHSLTHAMLNHHNNNNLGNANNSSPYGGTNAASAASGGHSISGLGLGISSQFSAAGLKADGSCNNIGAMHQQQLYHNHQQHHSAGLMSHMTMGGDGPPTPTHELDMLGDHRSKSEWSATTCGGGDHLRTKYVVFLSVDGGNSASMSSLQGVVTSTLRCQGPSLTPSLANYYRADLIAHVTNWPADMLEKQVSL